MRQLLYILGIVLLGAVVLSPAISYIGLDPVPGDFTIHLGNWHFAVPVVYSLCVSMWLALLYYLLKR